MGARKLRPDVPINLPKAFKEEARALRSKLLLYRFRRRAGVTLDESLIDPALEPRLNQILLPLLSVVSDASLRDALREAAREAQSALIADRGLSVEAQVLEVLFELMRSADGSGVAVGVLTAALRKRYGTEYDRPLTDRWIGAIVRKRLNLRTYKAHGVYVIPLVQRVDVQQLCARYGVETKRAAGEVGTSGTSHAPQP
jgi:hypothetical protein